MVYSFLKLRIINLYLKETCDNQKSKKFCFIVKASIIRSQTKQISSFRNDSMQSRKSAGVARIKKGSYSNYTFEQSSDPGEKLGISAFRPNSILSGSSFPVPPPTTTTATNINSSNESQ
jgi:hypothetical protein